MSQVLFLAPTPFFSDRGCHIRIYEEARWLIRLGVKVRIVTYLAGKDLPGLEIKRAGAYQKLEAGPSIRKPFADLSLLFLLKSQIKEFRPDLIHCHLHEGAFLGLLAKSANLPVVLDYQGSLAGELSEHQPWFRLRPVSALFRSAESWINSRVDRILLNCSALMSELNARANPKALVIGDGVDTERFVPQKPDQELGKKLGLSPEIPVVIYLGLLNRYQGIELLLRSAQILSARKQKAQFLIMGYPLGEYPDRAQKMGLSGLVKFTGRVDYFQAEKFLALGNIALAPKIARSEGNGKILNYLAMGLPTVCFDRPVNRELAGECAEYVEYVPADFERNAENLASGIVRLMEEPSRGKELSAQGRDRAEKDFSWEKVARKILESYQEWR